MCIQTPPHQMLTVAHTPCHFAPTTPHCVNPASQAPVGAVTGQEGDSDTWRGALTSSALRARRFESVQTNETKPLLEHGNMRAAEALYKAYNDIIRGRQMNAFNVCLICATYNYIYSVSSHTQPKRMQSNTWPVRNPPFMKLKFLFSLPSLIDGVDIKIESHSVTHTDKLETPYSFSNSCNKKAEHCCRIVVRLYQF